MLTHLGIHFSYFGGVILCGRLYMYGYVFCFSGIVLWVFDVKFISYLDYQIASVTTEHGTCVYQVMFVLDVSLVFYKPKVLGKFR